MVSKHKRVYECRGKYSRYMKTPKKPVWLVK